MESIDAEVRKLLDRHKAGNSDFRNLNLRGKSFKGLDLSGADFSDCDIRGCDFSDCNLGNTKFERCLIGANHPGQWFAIIVLVGASFICLKSGPTVFLPWNLIILSVPTCLGLFLLDTFFMVMRTLLLPLRDMKRFDRRHRDNLYPPLQYSFTEITSRGEETARFTDWTNLARRLILLDVMSINSVELACMTLVIVAPVIAVLWSTGRLFPTLYPLSLWIVAFYGMLLLSFITNSRMNWLKRYFSQQLERSLRAIAGTSFSRANLCNASFREAQMISGYFIGASLERVCWHKIKTVGRYVVLERSYLEQLEQNENVWLAATGQMPQEKHFSKLDLSDLFLSGLKLSECNFSSSDLNGSDLSYSDLSSSNLKRTQLLGADLSFAKITGVCIEDWNINSRTRFYSSSCDYIYFKADQQERRPRKGNFSSGEFSALVQKATDTIELVFVQGVDWNAFFRSFQELRSRYQDESISIQAIERKDSNFIIRLETIANLETNERIEEMIKESYRRNVRHLEAQVANYEKLIESEKQEKSTLIGIVKTMAESQRTPTHQTTINAEGSSIAAINSGSGNIHSISQTIGANLSDINKLVESLKVQAQSFPEEQRDGIQMTIEDLELDLSDETKRKPHRLGQRMRTLWLYTCAVAVGVAGVADFSNNLLELSEKLEVPIPIELIEQSPHVRPNP